MTQNYLPLGVITSANEESIIRFAITPGGPVYSLLETIATAAADVADSGLAELVGTGDTVAQNQYGDSVAVALGDAYSGEILDFMLYSTDGAILQPNGVLYIFGADPTITAGDAAITAAERITIVGQVQINTSDWAADANGASAFIFEQPVTFVETSTLWFVWYHEFATSMNGEQLRFVCKIRRGS